MWFKNIEECAYVYTYTIKTRNILKCIMHCVYVLWICDGHSLKT